MKGLVLSKSTLTAWRAPGSHNLRIAFYRFFLNFIIMFIVNGSSLIVFCTKDVPKSRAKVCAQWRMSLNHR